MGTWEGVELGGKWGAGQHREYFCNCCCLSEWKRDDFKLLLPKRCKVDCRFGGVGGGLVLGSCFLFFISLRLRMLVQ